MIPSRRRVSYPRRLYMLTSDFDYRLPPELIAQTPMEPRDHSRLLALNRTGGGVSHHAFRDLPSLLAPGDLLVFNDSRVFPARLLGRLADSDREIELLLLARLRGGRWRTLVKPGRRMREGAEFVVEGGQGSVRVTGRVLEAEDSGTRIVPLRRRFPLARRRNHPAAALHTRNAGRPPNATRPSIPTWRAAPPRRPPGCTSPSACCPNCATLGVLTAFVTLHVGWDSFRPVKSESAADHEMHSEYWELSESAAAAINRAKSDGRRVISVGTTARPAAGKRRHPEPRFGRLAESRFRLG